MKRSQIYAFKCMSANAESDSVGAYISIFKIMKIKTLILFCCLFAFQAFAQQPKPQISPVIPIKVDVSKMPTPRLTVETLPFFKPFFSFITDGENSCGICSKIISFQVTVIDIKDVVIGSKGNQGDDSKTYYATASIQYDNPQTMKFLPLSFDLQGDMLVSDESATNCKPCSGTIFGGSSQYFGNGHPRKFTLSINTCKDGSATPNKLSLKIDGVLMSFTYQTIGNSTLYANNGKQIIIITMGKGSYCGPC
jgi:hypothetical protein